MNHNAAFFNTAAENPPRVLRLRLRPLTLGHIYVLNCVESPFVSEHGEITEADFFIAVFVCSQKWQDAERALNSRWLGSFVRVWKFFTRKKSMVRQLTRFQAYLSEGLRAPKFKNKLDAEELESPWFWRLMAFLLSEMHLSESDSMDCRVWRANALYAAYAEMKHDLKLISQRDQDLWEYAAQEDAKLAQQKRN